MSRNTRPAPPPDPLDAAEEAHARSREANARFRDADDFDEPTGQHEAIAPHFHVHVDPPARAPLASVTDADIPKNHTLAGTIATLIAAAAAALVAKLLGKL